MSNTSIKHREITRLKNGYELEVVRLEDVLADINFSNDDDFNICKDIIVNLEFKAGDIIAQNKTVSLPYIGRLRKPLVKKEFAKSYKLLKVAKSVLTKEEFKDYARDTYNEAKEKVMSWKKNDQLRRKLIAANNKKYKKIYLTFGEKLANVWIESLLWLTPVEFNQEVQDVFDEIERNENNNRKINNRR